MQWQFSQWDFAFWSLGLMWILDPWENGLNKMAEARNTDKTAKLLHLSSFSSCSHFVLLFAVHDLTARTAIEDRLWVRIYIFIYKIIYFFISLFFYWIFEGVSRGGPYRWSMDRSVRWSVDPSVGLVHGPGVSVFGSPRFKLVCECKHWNTWSCSYEQGWPSSILV